MEARNPKTNSCGKFSAQLAVAVAVGRLVDLAEADNHMQSMLSITNITKTYQLGNQTIEVLRGVSVEIKSGEFVAIMGSSGSGKSTLMNIIGLLDTPTTGRYLLDGESVEGLAEDDQARVRSRMIGFVFQSYNLLPRMDAVKQVAIPLVYQGVPAEQRTQRAIEALTAVGLADRLHNKPNEMSGGQQQRVAIARAIATNPAIILADEPTGALDSKTGAEVLDIFKKLNQAGKTVIMVTHDLGVAKHAKRIIQIKDGLIVQ